MAVMPLFPETKMVDVGYLISLRNLLVRKVMWLLLTTMSATLILSHAFGADCMARIADILSSSKNSLHFDLQTQYTLSPFHIFTSRDNTHTHTHSLSLSLSLSLSFSYILTSNTQPHENVYILQPFSFLFCLFG